VVAAILIAPRIPGLLPLRSFQLPSSNMEPTIMPGDHFFADMAHYRFNKPARGDLVLFSSPLDPSRTSLMRVIGLEGETIEIRNKVVYLDGRPLADPWGHIREPLSGGHPLLPYRDNLAPLRIPAGTVFVLGDNRDNSYDSRFFGSVPLSNLRGRPLFVYWSAHRPRIGKSLK
jgi:signal peptidase I